MKQWLLLVLLLVLPGSLTAQNTLVSGTITDSGGVVWKNGTYSFKFVASPDNPTGKLFQNGVAISTPQDISGSLDSTGSLTSVSVPDNLTITPSKSTWNLAVCPAATATNGCFIAKLTITGVSQNVTSSVTPPAVIVNMQNPPINPSAYVDAEIVGARQGNTYFNLTDQTTHICALPVCTWISVNLTTGNTNTWTAQQNFDANTAFKGPNPWVDITRYGARALPFGTNPASTTATCTASSTAVTLAANNGGQFLNGDSIRLDGCGPTSTIAAPTGVAVSPGMNAGGSMSVSAANMGATTYNYRVIACDASGGCSAASPIVSTATGAATLGRVMATISTMSLSNNTVTVTTTAAHGFIVGAVVTIVPFTTSPAAPAFEGTFVVGSVPTSTTFTFTSSLDSRAPGTATSATGGTVAGFNCNVITWTQPATIPWKYYLYSNRGGAGYVLVWQGMASNIGPGMAAQDYGSPMMDTQVFNSWVPTTPPTAATNDYLVTTVSSGGGTTSIVVANAPTNSNTGGTAQMGSDVSIINAAAAAKFGTLYIPTGIFWTAGFVDLSPDTPLHVFQAGQINNTDTWRLPGSLQWEGWGINNPVAFSWTGVPIFQGVNGAYPVMYFKNVGSTTYNRIQVASTSTNGNLLFYADDPLAINPPTNFTFNYVNWVVGTGGLTNYMGMIGIFTGGGFSYTFDHNIFSGAQAPTGLLGDIGQTFLPGWSFTNSKVSPYTCTAGYAVRNSWFVGRSSFEQNVSTNLGAATGCIPEQIFEFDQTQNLDVPLYITTGPFLGNSQASVTMRDIYAADFPVAIVGNFSNQLSGIQVIAHGAVGSGITGGHSAYTGGPVVISTNTNQQISAPVPGAGTSGGTNGGNNANNSAGFYVMGGTGGVGTLLPPPAAPTLAAGAGTLIPVGTHTFAVQWIDNFGHFSPMGATASITLVANTQNVTVTPPTPPAGAVGYVIQMDGSGIQATSGGSCFATYTPASAANVPGASSGCANTGGQTFWASTGTNAVASGALPTTLTASQMQIVNGFVLTLAAPGGGFTANRTATIPDNTGTVAETNLAQTWSAMQTFKNIENSQFSVRGYGAKGDGVTDDTVAIQAAINAAQTNLGGTIFFSCGNYVVNSTLTYTGNGAFGYGLRFRGEDWGCVQITKGASLVNWFFDNAVPATPIAHLDVENLHLVAAGATIGGIHLNNVNYGSLDKIWFSNVNGYAAQHEPVGGNIIRATHIRIEDNFEAASAAFNVLGDWFHGQDIVVSKVLNPAIVVGSSTVKPYNIMFKNVHCFHCRDYIFSLQKILEFSATETAEELDNTVNKTHQFGVLISATVTDPQTLSFYRWGAQTVGGGGFNASYAVINNLSTASVIGFADLGGQSPLLLLNTPTTKDSAFVSNVTASNAANSLIWQLNGANKWGLYIDGSNFLGAYDFVAAKESCAFLPLSAGGGFSCNGATSGAVNVTPPTVASGSLNLINGPDTVVGLAAMQTLTNKYALNQQTSAVTNFGTALGAQTAVPSAQVTANSSFKLTIVLVQSTLGVGCGAGTNTATPTFSFTAPGGTAQTFAGTALSISANGTLDTQQASETIVAVKSGVAVTYTTASTLASAGCTTVPQYTAYAKVQ